MICVGLGRSYTSRVILVGFGAGGAAAWAADGGRRHLLPVTGGEREDGNGRGLELDGEDKMSRAFWSFF